jgi:PKD repeat protein
MEGVILPNPGARLLLAFPLSPPTVNTISTNTTNDKSVAMTLPATGSGLTLRIISQPASGSVGLSGSVATYFPAPGFVGTDKFTFAAYDGSKNSNLATGSVAVAQGPFGISATAHVPPSYPVSWPVAFAVVPVVTNNSSPVTFVWNFGDGTAFSASQFPQHAYSVPGNYTWTVVSSVSSARMTNSGSILIGNPVMLGIANMGGSLALSWPNTIADTLLEGTDALGPSAKWVPVTNAVNVSQSTLSVSVSATGNRFFRVRQLW